MSVTDVKEIILKAATDKDYRSKLLNPKTREKLLQRYPTLTKQEKQCFYGLNIKQIEKAISTMQTKPLAYANDIRF